MHFRYRLWILFPLVLCSYTLAGGEQTFSSEQSVCAYLVSAVVRQPVIPPRDDGAVLSPSEDALIDDSTIRCGASRDYCYAYGEFLEENKENASLAVRFYAQGCWTGNECNERCIPQEAKARTFFCCCKGYKCNDVVPHDIPTRNPVTSVPEADEYPQQYLYWIVIVCLFFVAISLLALAMVCCVRKPKSASSSSLSKPTEEELSTPSIDLDSMKFFELIGQGRFGTVYRAVISNEVVAVKTFSLHQHSSFLNEKYIYSLPLMQHPNILSYLGSGECLDPNGSLSYGIVLSYCPRGRLNTYLENNVLDWASFCHIAITATRGLAHLHSEIAARKDLVKPCVCHRDFNTRNILLTENLSCVVADLGFAIHTKGSNYYINGNEHRAETVSLTDVGTLRYMAPEILEGAVNLQDCEASLKQIDIYALGLILWECASRCCDLFQGMQTPAYALPFQAEIGLHPRFEQMQVLVARHKARPLFPVAWKDSNPAIRDLKETIEDCWDDDAEARLSATCAEARLLELPRLWERHKASINAHNSAPAVVSMPNDLGTTKALKLDISGKFARISDGHHVIRQDTKEPLEKNECIKSYHQPNPVLQPHQGFNPCLQRNLAPDLSSEINIQGNCIISAGSDSGISTVNTARLLNAFERLNVLDGLVDTAFINEHLIPLLNEEPHQTLLTAPPPSVPVSLVPHVPAIPYVQNKVRGGSPKKPNLDKCSATRWQRLKALWHLIRSSHNSDEDKQEILLVSPQEPVSPVSITQNNVALTFGGPRHAILPLRNIPETDRVSHSRNHTCQHSSRESTVNTDSTYLRKYPSVVNVNSIDYKQCNLQQVHVKHEMSSQLSLCNDRVMCKDEKCPVSLHKANYSYSVPVGIDKVQSSVITI